MTLLRPDRVSYQCDGCQTVCEVYGGHLPGGWVESPPEPERGLFGPTHLCERCLEEREELE